MELLECDNEVISQILEYSDGISILKFMSTCKYIYENIKILRFTFPYYIENNILEKDIFKNIEHIFFKDKVLYLNDNDVLVPKYNINKFNLDLNSMENLKTIHLIDRINVDTIQNIQNIKNIIYVLYPDNFDTLNKFNPNCNIKLVHGFINKTTNILFSDFYPPELNNLPVNVTEIDCGNYYSKTLAHLPINLKKLKLGNHFVREFNGSNLINLIKLEFGDYFNENITNLPPNLKYLKFGYYFDSIISKYPLNLEYLEFGNHYNQPINNLPQKLKILILGYYFKQPINNLPDSLIDITLGESFCWTIKYPSSLKSLKIKYNLFDIKIDGWTNLKNLMNLDMCYNNNNNFKSLINLRYLSIKKENFYFDKIELQKCNKLKYLELGFKIDILHLPKNLEILKLNYELKNKFPRIYGHTKINIIYNHNKKIYSIERKKTMKDFFIEMNVKWNKFIDHIL